MNRSTYDAFAPKVIKERNLSHAWGHALLHLVNMPGNEIRPLMVSIKGFDDDGEPEEDPAIRKALDDFLEKNDKWSVEIVAFTIFPKRYLKIADLDRESFYQLCHDALPHIKATNPGLNARGLYFERLLEFGSGKFSQNQLEFILTEYLQGRRRNSKFLATIYDPARDQSRQPYQTFPCLQTISFVPTGDGLVMNAFYAMQYLVQRGYGNFLGLAHLGAFMGREMGLPLKQLNIMAGVEKLDFTKEKLEGVVRLVKARLEQAESALPA